MYASRVCRLALSLAVLLAAGWPPAEAAMVATEEAAFPSGWAYRRALTIVQSGDPPSGHFQVAIDIPSSFDFSRARADGADLRVTLDDGVTPAPFWLERWDSLGQTGRLWIRVPELPRGATTAYLYYGNPEAEPVSSGEATFDFFDGFEGGSGQGYWSLGPPRTIMQIDQGWETEGPHTLSVVPTPEGAPWRYFGYYGLEGCTGIGMAGSDDLTTWTKLATNPLFTGGGERWPHVVLDDGTYHMVHTVDFCGTSSIVRRTSTDGRTWSGPTQVVAPEWGEVNQNPNLWHDPNDGQWYFYWFQGDLSTEWRIMARTATTVAGLDSAPGQQLLASPTTLAAPNLMFRDGEYFLATEILVGDVWKVRVYSGPTPLGPFTALPGNPVLDDDCGCLFQLPEGDTLYDYYCKRSDHAWRLDMAIGDMSEPRPTFHALDLTRWTEQGGDWTVRTATQPDGAAGTVASVEADGRNLLTSAYVAADCNVAAWGQLLDGRVLGLSVRMPDASTGYSLNLYEDLDEEANLFLYRWENGIGTEVWSTAVGPVSRGTWYKLRLGIGPEGARVWLDDVLHTPDPVGGDPGSDPGPVALYTEPGSKARFDDVRVARYAAEEPLIIVGHEDQIVPPNTPPVATILTPADGSFYVADVPVFMQGAAADSEDAPPNPTTEFRVLVHEDDEAQVAAAFPGDTATYVPADDDGDRWLELLYIVRDSGGLRDTARVQLRPEVDLAPSAVAAAPDSPGTTAPATYRFRIRNLGGMPSPAFHWTLRADDVGLAEGDTAIAAHDSVEILRTVAPLLPVGTHTLRVTADTLSAVYETDESNNVSAGPIRIVSNLAPVLAAIGNRQGNEGEALAFTAIATDPESPPQTLIWSLGAGTPAGASIDSVSGDFAWTPSEAQGPGDYELTFRVTDDGVPPLAGMETITIHVSEVNAAPALAGIPEGVAVPELHAFRFTATATDEDVPAQALTFSLAGEVPEGASIDSTTGTFAWTPGEAQGPGVFGLDVRVSDGVDTTAAPIVVTVTEVVTATVADLSASKVRTGNDGDGTCRILLAWSATDSGTTVEVYRAARGGYPFYADTSVHGPPRPASYPPGPGWTLTPVTAPGMHDEPASRDLWYYVAFVREGLSLSEASAMTSGTLNYLLGDVTDGWTPGQGDSRVDTADLALLAFHYGASGADLDSVPYLDFGPTANASVDACPLNDGRVGFEELAILGLSYEGAAPPPASATPGNAVLYADRAMNPTPSPPAGPPLELWIDADAIPRDIRDILLRAAVRLGMKMTLVANREIRIPPGHPTVSTVVVEGGADVADRYIADHAAPEDVAVTADVPLASILVGRGLAVIDPRGREYTPENIGEILATRDLLYDLRGAGQVTGGPAALGARDLQAFANTLDRVLTRRIRAAASP